MKIAFIVPYFGILPSYFQLFLDSCESNARFDWLIFTDDMSDYIYPSNVHRIRMTFEECKSLFEKSFDFPISLERVHKLCDFKCSYGYVFQNWIKEYDWWGHCDLDQIFGDISSFITQEMLEKYVKIGSLGHFTLFRNTPTINRVFTNSLNGRIRYMEVFGNKESCVFDEWLPESINDIFLETEYPVDLTNKGADVDPYHTCLVTLSFEIPKREYHHNEEKYSVFQWDHGHIYQYYRNGTGLKRKEYSYVHLQKRKMYDKRERKTGTYLITHNAFINGKVDEALSKERIWLFLNYQYFRVKWENFKIRCKTNNWHFK